MKSNATNKEKSLNEVMIVNEASQPPNNNVARPSPARLSGPCTVRFRPRLALFPAVRHHMPSSARIGTSGTQPLRPRIISQTYRRQMIFNTTHLAKGPVIHVEDSSSSEVSAPSSDGDFNPPTNGKEKKSEIVKKKKKKNNKTLSKDVIVLDSDSDTEDSSKSQKESSNDHQWQLRMFRKILGKNMVPDAEATNLLKAASSCIDFRATIRRLTDPTIDRTIPRRRNHNRSLYQCIKQTKSLVKISSFLDAGADPNVKLKGTDGGTALHLVASHGLIEILLLMLLKVGKGRVNVGDDANRTPLFFAIEKKHIAVVEILLKAGADIHCLTTDHQSLLHVASRNGLLNVVKHLVEKGLQINHQDKYGWTALMWSTEHDSNAPIVSYLISKGAKLDLVDNEGNISLHWASMSAACEVVRELVNKQQLKRFPINARNKFGETALHVSAKGDNFLIASYLVVQGIDPTIKNKNGQIALDLCPEGSKTRQLLQARALVTPAKKKPFLYIRDISNGKERVPVSVLNEIDNEAFPSDFVYISRPVESNDLKVNIGLSTLSPCKCEGVCTTDCKCVNLSENRKLWYYEDGRIDISIFDEDSPVLFECTPLCPCGKGCVNRVVQRSIRFPLQVVKTANKGWGLRTLSMIPQGAFILSYVGELITDEEAEKRNADTYLFNLDLKTSGDEPNCMDALRFGNCGRFINHSCDANLRAVKLFTAHRDVSCPEIAFFAYKDIVAKEELCFNYGDSFWDVKIQSQMYCKCKSHLCQYERP